MTAGQDFHDHCWFKRRIHWNPDTGILWERWLNILRFHVTRSSATIDIDQELKRYTAKRARTTISGIVLHLNGHAIPSSTVYWVVRQAARVLNNCTQVWHLQLHSSKSEYIARLVGKWKCLDLFYLKQTVYNNLFQVNEKLIKNCALEWNSNSLGNTFV